MTGGTLIAGVQALKEQGASEVNVFVTHALFCGERARSSIDDSEIDRIVVTDTRPDRSARAPRRT